jgi:hypothetical protein
VSINTFGSAQYQWHPTEKGGHADPDGPILRSTITANPETLHELPQASVTVIRGNLGAGLVPRQKTR